MEDSAVYKSLIYEPSPPKKSSLPPLRLQLTAILVALGGPFNFGYQLLITNPAQEAFLQFLNDSHYLNKNEALEREQLEQTNAATYAIARFLLGLSIAISLGTAPMFITECSPKECRGVTSLVNGVVLQVALVVGAILAMPQIFGNTNDWWKLYATEFLLTVVVMMLVPFIHESPGFLHSRGHANASERSLSFYHGVDGEDLRIATKELEEERGKGQQLGLVSLWKDPVSRRGTLVGAVVMASMAMSGIAAINAFAFEILLSTGLNVLQASIGNIIICIMSVLGILTSSFIIDRFGRRVLLLPTYSLLAVINVFIAAFMLGFEHFQISALGYPLLCTICMFNFVFAAGPGPVSLFITGELVGQHARGAACTWANVCMCLL
ncbi:Tat pathway signal sequence domain protein [Oesophagostomum dentatum]|uniref:Tat pathway signal sequence domain protein n=1 Tax=Oesophagostomum dentatum TaxID=61180 RepID=A0A0B1T0K8_OESDE|nr:Tat pathway signal sequence domain protein [Oesophagostomum dentatum]